MSFTRSGSASWLAAALVCSCLAACSHLGIDQDKTADRLGVGLPPEQSQVADVRYKTPPEFTPLESYVQSWEDWQLDGKATVYAWTKCLTQMGREPIHADVPAVKDTQKGGTFYAQPSPEHARTVGYTRGEKLRENGVGILKLKPGVSNAQMNQLVATIGGKVPGSCVSKEFKKIDQASADGAFSSHRDQLAASQSARTKIILGRLEVDEMPQVRAAAQRWKSCMTAAGHQVVSPQHQVELNAWPSASANPEWGALAEEKQVAQKDAECRSTSGYLDAYVTAVDSQHTKFALENFENLKHSSAERRAARRAHIKKYLAGKL